MAFTRTRLRIPKGYGLGQWDIILPAITSVISTAGSLAGSYINAETNKSIAKLQIASSERIATVNQQLAALQLQNQQVALLSAQNNPGATRLPDPQPSAVVTSTGQVISTIPVAAAPTTEILPGISIPAQVAGIPTSYLLIGGIGLAALFLLTGKEAPGAQAKSRRNYR